MAILKEVSICAKTLLENYWIASESTLLISPADQTAVSIVKKAFSSRTSSPDVSLDFVVRNIRTLGKTKLTVSLGTIHLV